MFLYISIYIVSVTVLIVHVYTCVTAIIIIIEDDEPLLRNDIESF